MSYNLIIWLRNSNDSISLEWLRSDYLSHSNDDGAADTFSNVAKNAQDIVVLVPSVDVLITQIKLPKLSKTKLTKAIPYALDYISGLIYALNHTLHKKLTRETLCLLRCKTSV